MVRAILDGRKTQTRRIVKLEPWVARHGGDLSKAWPDKAYGVTPCLKVPCSDETVQRMRNPWGFPEPGGVRLWVRETWAADEDVDDCAPRNLGESSSVIYLADGMHKGPPARPGKTRPGIFMPRWASRIILDVTGVRAERINDISDEDAIAEGIVVAPGGGWTHDASGSIGFAEGSPRGAFFALWRLINGEDSLRANPWVWVPSFKRVTP